MAISQKMIVDCMKREKASAIPERKCSRKGNHQHPLFAWIQGAHSVGLKSAIQCVQENKTRWPWTTQNASGHEFMRRLCNKKQLSFLQKTWLNYYVERRFQGVYKDRWVSIESEFSVPEKTRRWSSVCAREVELLMNKCMEKSGINPSDPPLRVILSPELTMLINLKFMEYYL